MQSVHITIDVVSSNIAEILLKVAINIIKHTNKTNLMNSWWSAVNQNVITHSNIYLCFLVTIYTLVIGMHIPGPQCVPTWCIVC
jgi:hypothetical protein